MLRTIRCTDKSLQNLISRPEHRSLNETETHNFESSVRSVVLVLIEIGTDMLLAVTITLQSRSSGFVVETLRVQLWTTKTVDVWVAFAAQSPVSVGAA